MIFFHYEEYDHFEIYNKLTSQWLNTIAENYEYHIEELNYIFCSDDYLLQINRQYLQHDYYTDIITFDNSEDESTISGDIFISVDRIKENAVYYSTTFDKELRRVIAHGLLHLIGYGDKNKEEQIVMRKNEDACLSLWAQIKK